MKFNLSSFINLSLAVVITSLPLKLWATAPDWNAINNRLTDVAKDHIRAFDFIHDAHATVNLAETDWSLGNVRFNFDVQSSDLYLISTPDVQTVEVNGDFHLTTIDVPAGKQVTASLDFTISGNIIYVLRHINELVMDCTVEDPADVFLTEFCQYSSIIAGSDDVKDFQPALEHFKNAILSIAGSTNSNPQTLMEQIFFILSQAKVVGDDQHVAFLADINLKQVFGLDIEGTAQLKLTNNALTLEIIGVSEMDAQTYQDFKTTLEGYLTKFQDGDQTTLEKLYEYSFLLFSLIEGFLS